MTQDNANTIANGTPPEREVMCSKCIYWKELPATVTTSNGVVEIEGACHLHAPVVITALTRILSAFPSVPATEWCGDFDGGDEDDEDEDEELEDKPTYDDLVEMLQATMESTGQALAKLDAIRSVIADQPNRRNRGHKSGLVFHKITEQEKEIYDYLKQMAIDRQGMDEHLADELAEVEKQIMADEEAPVDPPEPMLDPDDPFDAEALDAFNRAVEKKD